MEPWWEFIVKHEDMLRRICSRRSNGRYDLVDDMYSSCVIGRCKAIYDTYDPAHESGASLKTHMITNMKLYMFKYMQALGRNYRERFDVSLPADYDEGYYEGDDLELKDWVEEIMDRLEPHHADIIKMYHWEGLLHREIAERLGFRSKGAGRSRYLAAMQRVREIIDEMD